MELRILQTLGVADILLDLLTHGPSQKVDFRRRTKLAPSTLQRAHEILFSGGYLDTERDPKKLLFKLSDKGRKVAESIRAITLDGEPPDEITRPEMKEGDNTHAPKEIDWSRIKPAGKRYREST